MKVMKVNEKKATANEVIEILKAYMIEADEKAVRENIDWDEMNELFGEANGLYCDGTG